MFHLSMLHGAVVMQMALGGRLVLMRGRFDPEQTLRVLERERVTLWPALGSAALASGPPTAAVAAASSARACAVSRATIAARPGCSGGAGSAGLAGAA